MLGPRVAAEIPTRYARRTAAVRSLQRVRQRMQRDFLTDDTHNDEEGDES